MSPGLIPLRAAGVPFSTAKNHYAFGQVRTKLFG